MIETLLSPNEAQRLSALYALKILDTPPEDRFDRVIRLVKTIFNVPFAMVTLVDSDRHQLMDGKIEVNSQPAQSSTFTILLALEPPQEIQHTP